jgi:thioredoxin reductase (NADPH)
MEKVLIIGAGPAGYTAAIYAARANLNPLVIAGPLPGGQLMLTSDIENFPGFIDPIPGPELMEAMRQQSERAGARYNYSQVTEVDFSKPPFKIWTDGDETFESQTVIICTGASSRMLGLPGEKEMIGKGISTCAVCDGFFYKGKDVIVVGGGDSALEEASYLSKIVNTVTLVHRREKFRASKIMQDRVLSLPNVTPVWNAAVEKILLTPEGKLRGALLKQIGSGESIEKKCDGVFVAIGHIPGTEVFKKWLDLDEEGYIKVQNGFRTNIDGVFAAGDCVDRVYRQAVTAAGMGCMAALDCERYLSFMS